MNLSAALPAFARELAEGLAAIGRHDLAASVAAVDIVSRCDCDEVGCLTFFGVPKAAAPSHAECERVFPRVVGLTCVHYDDRGALVWLEALGRPLDRIRLDEIWPPTSA